MTAMQPYPAYRDSGVEWLGEVPEHWELRRMATVADLRVSNVDKHVREGESPVRLCNYLDVYHNERIGAHLPFMAGTAKEREIRKFRLYVGDVLITKDSEDWSDIGVPALVDYAAQDLVCGYHLAMLRPDGTSLAGGYLFHALKDSHVAWQCQVAAAGVTRYGLSRNAIRSMRIPLPPLPEQTAIARFLDDADRRIRRYVRAKERLIELLEEERRATIHEAVTGRIDVRTDLPYPAYKDSGIEWLGKVPEHWEVRRLKTLCDMRSGDTITATSIDEVGEYRVFGGNGIRGYSSRYTHDGDYVLIGRQGALCGNVHIARGRFWASEHAVVATLHCGHVLNWFGAALETMNLNQYSIAAAQPGLSVDRLLHLWVPVPPAHEQGGIARFLAAAARRLSARRGTVARQIALLREYRTRLIADVVTGTIDVREATARPPKGESDNPQAEHESGDLASRHSRLEAETCHR